jgi:hypothetical protein
MIDPRNPEAGYVLVALITTLAPLLGFAALAGDLGFISVCRERMPL